MDESKALAEDMDKFSNEMSYRGKAHQQLVTDKDGKAQWEDQLAYDGRIEISWDGDTTDRVSFTDSWQRIYYKISDLTPTKEEIIGGVIKFGSNHDPVVITQNGILDLEEEWYATGADGEIIVSFVDNFKIESDGTIIPERGTYVYYDEADEVKGYIKSLTYGKIKQLDEKFLPSSPNQPLNVVFIQQDPLDISSITCNLTYGQIREQIDNDLPIIATFRHSENRQRYFIIELELGENYIGFVYLANGHTDRFNYFSDGTFGEVGPS